MPATSAAGPGLPGTVRTADRQERFDPNLMALAQLAGFGSRVERTGIEPVTSGLQSRRSPS